VCVTFRFCTTKVCLVSILSDYRLDDRVRSVAEATVFSSSICVHTSSEAHPVSYPIGTGGIARPGRDADYSRTASAEIKNEYELYFLSPLAPA
jgi:hypothetical protein